MLKVNLLNKGGSGKYGHVWVEFSPNEPGKGYEFTNAIVGGVVPREYIPAVSAGIQEAFREMVLLPAFLLWILRLRFMMVLITM